MDNSCAQLYAYGQRLGYICEDSGTEWAGCTSWHKLLDVCIRRSAGDFIQQDDLQETSFKNRTSPDASEQMHPRGRGLVSQHLRRFNSVLLKYWGDSNGSWNDLKYNN